MKKHIKSFLSDLFDFAFVSHCMSCKRAVSGGALICRECEKELEKTDDRLCIKCGINKKRCQCGIRVYHFSRITAPFYNKGIAQRGLYRFKFAGAKELAHIYGQAMAEKVRLKYYDVDFSNIAYVPTSKIKEFERGFDQSQCLAEYISKEINVPVAHGVLRRSVFSKTQHKSKGVDNRFLNAYHSYYHKGSINGGNVLLVDDIKTTGASLDACSRQLLMAGADEVFCVTALITDKNS